MEISRCQELPGALLMRGIGRNKQFAILYFYKIKMYVIVIAIIDRIWIKG